MTQQRSLLDPFGVWAQLAGQLEKLNAEGNRGMATPAFSQAMNRAVAAGVGARKVSAATLRRAYEALNIASHEDVRALDERLQAIDERLMAIQDLLRRLDPDAARSATATPPRTRKPPPAAPPQTPAPAPAPAVPAPASATRAAKPTPARKAASKRRARPAP